MSVVFHTHSVATLNINWYWSDVSATGEHNLRLSTAAVFSVPQRVLQDYGANNYDEVHPVWSTRNVPTCLVSDTASSTCQYSLLVWGDCRLIQSTEQTWRCTSTYDVIIAVVTKCCLLRAGFLLDLQPWRWRDTFFRNIESVSPYYMGLYPGRQNYLLHCITLNYSTIHYITLNYTAIPTIHYIILNYTTINYTTATG